MRSINEILNLESSEDLTPDERRSFEKWLDTEARYMMSSSDYCCLLGWYTLNSDIPLSPKEAGFN